MDKFFRFGFLKLLLAGVAFIVFVVLHNLISGLLNVEEAIFFILAIFGVPAYVLFMIVYSIYKAIKGE